MLLRITHVLPSALTLSRLRPTSQSSIGRLQTMEQFTKLAKDLECTVTSDLDRIQELAPGCSEYTDNIRIHLAGQISAMVALVEEKGRSNKIRLNLSNKFHYVGSNQRQNVLVFIMAVTKRPNTTRAVAKYAVVWGQAHQLNITRQNPLPAKSRTNTSLLGILAALHQANVLKFRRLTVMINSPGVKALVDRLPLLHAQNFLDDNGLQIEHYEVLTLIHKILNDGKIKIHFFFFRIQVNAPCYQHSG